MIRFNDLIVEGFGSIINELDFNFEDFGISIIRGVNGSGKSTFISNTVAWAIYNINLKGGTLSKIPTKKDWRGKDWRGTRVIISFTKDEDNYVIARHISFKGSTFGITGGSSVLVYKNDELIPDRDKDDIQEYINKVIGINSKVFLNSILFGQRMKRFIEGTPAEKREVFESIFDISFIEEAQTSAKYTIDELNDSKVEYNRQIQVRQVKIKHLGESIVRINKVTAEFEKNKAKEINDKKILLVEQEDKTLLLNALIEDVRNDLKVAQECADKNSKTIDKDIHACELRILVIQKELNLFILNEQKQQMQLSALNSPDVIETICPTCTNTLTKIQIEKLSKKYDADLKIYNYDVKVLTNSIIESDKLRKTLTIEYDELKAKLLIYTKALSKDVDDKSKITDHEHDMNILVEKSNSRDTLIKAYTKDIETLQNKELVIEDVEDLKKLVVDIEKGIESREQELVAVDESLEIYEWWYKHGFSNKGLKGYVLNSALVLLNASIYKYSSRLGIKIEFTVDTTKASKPFITKCFDGATELDYNEFSGGEKARIDVATAFAMYDLVSSSVKFNILILDEIFEGMDETGIEDVFDLIRLMAKDKALYVITHSPVIDSLNTKLILVEKHNRNTIIK